MNNGRFSYTTFNQERGVSPVPPSTPVPPTSPSAIDTPTPIFHAVHNVNSGSFSHTVFNQFGRAGVRLESEDEYEFEEDDDEDDDEDEDLVSEVSSVSSILASEV